jgi:hypothetical protein
LVIPDITGSVLCVTCSAYQFEPFNYRVMWVEADNHDTAQLIMPLAPPQHHILSLNTVYVTSGSQDSVVGIMTSNELDGSGFKPPLGKRSAAPIQFSPKAHPVTHTRGTRAFLRGIRQLGYGFHHPPPSSTEANIKVELHLHPHPSMPLWHVTGRISPLFLLL